MKKFLRRFKQLIVYLFKSYIGLRNFRYNCTRGQLNNELEEKPHEIKQSRGKTEIGKEVI